MATGMKAACLAALAMGLLGATTAAKAGEAQVKPPYGGAPSPEVNTLLGLFVVAGTVAFIKRRRGSKIETETSAV